MDLAVETSLREGTAVDGETICVAFKSSPAALDRKREGSSNNRIA
jgi:hypothetical protein